MMTQNPEENKLSDTQARRKRLHFRSWHRGTKEMDVLLGRFADRHLPDFNDEQLGRYERLLNNSDPDLYNWISGFEPLPPSEDNDVMRLFMNFRLA